MYKQFSTRMCYLIFYTFIYLLRKYRVLNLLVNLIKKSIWGQKTLEKFVEVYLRLVWHIIYKPTYNWKAATEVSMSLEVFKHIRKEL